MGLSISYGAKMGVFDPGRENNRHREFYFEPVLVNNANAQQMKVDYVDNIPKYDWNDYWSRVQDA
jgi:hypothetical protein